MKKFFLIAILGLLVLAGCTTTDTPTTYSVGTGSVTSISARDYNDETGVAGRVQVNTTYATVALDADGKFVYVAIDVAQNDGTFDEEGNIVAANAIPTKKERGDAYGMKGRSEIGKEWYEQIAALEEWMIGKTLAEVKALPLTDNYITDGEDLKSSVTITVDSYLAAVEKAVANAVEVENVAKVGSLSTTSVSGRAYNVDTAVEGRIQVNVTFAGVAYDADGKVVYVHIDVAQNQGTFNEEGVVVAANPIPTKKERGADYGMKGRSEIGKEWDEQIAELEAWMMGKTLTEVKALPLTDNYISDGEDLKSSVTVTVDSYLEAFEKASNNTTDLQ